MRFHASHGMDRWSAAIWRLCSIADACSSLLIADYATRERPIVCTPGALGPADHVAAAGVVEAATPAEFAIAVVGRPDAAVARRAWVATRSWNAQWQGWASAAFGGGE